MSFDSPLDSIPSLIPSKPSAALPRSRSPKDAEAIDKYAILFSPSTPHASPTLAPTSPPAPNSRPPSHAMPSGPNSSDSEFGSFVSVPSSQDPLSLFFLDSSFISTVAPSAVAPSSKPGETITDPMMSASLDFFGKFSQNAKLAAEKNKHVVLDELLMHEDDPLYWLKDSGETVQEQDSKGKGKEPVSESLLDLNLDESYFSPSKIIEEVPPPQPQHASSLPDATINHSPTRVRPHRSPTISPSTLARPLASTSSASALNTESTSLTDADPQRPASVGGRPSSYSTLSNFSSRWIPSLLATSTRATPSRPSLDDLFARDPTVAMPQHPTASTSHAASRPYTVPHRAATVTRTPGSLSISHGTPFASHIFVPPSGAPGFQGTPYDWDKGFSNALERELELDGAGGEDSVDREMGEMTRLTGPSASAGSLDGEGRISVGGLIERKSGRVELCGRGEATVQVLDLEIADQVRAHLPALSRLPRTWSLVYSLDQHGISLKTLYTRSENPPKPSTPPHLGAGLANPGRLVVVRDAGGTVFGAWVGEGVRPSRGKGYYGSGESFLWRYAGGTLDVFKWTGQNDYVALCEPEFISFGGGDGHYGLYLDDTLLDGSSARCPTFDNEPLCSPGPKKGGTVSFECVGLEVWAIGS